MSDEEIRALWAGTQDRITELFSQVCAIQTFLQQAGLFSAAEVQQRAEEIRTSWSTGVQSDLAESREKQAREQIRLLLESFEGKKQ
jgi:hypothetical protein